MKLYFSWKNPVSPRKINIHISKPSLYVVIAPQNILQLLGTPSISLSANIKYIREDKPFLISIHL